MLDALDREPADSEPMVEWLAAEAKAIRAATHNSDRFPSQVIDRLSAHGVLVAPLPRCDGGLGWGTDGDRNTALCAALRNLGFGNLGVGRIYEAHVNVIALICRYGDAAVQLAATADIRNRHLFALWVAPAHEPVRLYRCRSAWRLSGDKPFCTAAGFATRAVVTALDDRDEERMILVDASQGRIGEAAVPLLHGMRNTSTRPTAFDIEVAGEQFIGVGGDYLREPEFSVGAWRTSAVTAGGLQALIDETVKQLRARGRHANPHQSTRIGQMLIRSMGATMWATAAAERAGSIDERDVIAYINLARVAIENACLEAIPLVQRSLGLASVVSSNPVEHLIRDLDTYLRQPAGDEVLSEAAVHFAETGATR